MIKDDTQTEEDDENVLVEKELENETEIEEENELLQKLEEAESKFKRALADYQNLEKRVIEDRREWIKSANKDLLQRLLPVLDTLMLAQKHDKNKTLEISINQFLDVLKSEGVVKIETLGKTFDPKTMECVTMVEGEDGKVVEEVRTGFILGDRLLRPAQVIVGEKKGKQ